MPENKFDTLRIHAGYDPKDHRFASSVPIYQTAAFGLENTAMADKIVTLVGMIIRGMAIQLFACLKNVLQR